VKRRPIQRWGLGLLTLLLAGCSQAPVYDVMGSLFPAWLVCIAVGELLMLIARAVLVRLQIKLCLPLLAYLCIGSIFTFTIWLLFY
jgi:hypothetical protein